MRIKRRKLWGILSNDNRSSTTIVKNSNLVLNQNINENVNPLMNSWPQAPTVSSQQSSTSNITMNGFPFPNSFLQNPVFYGSVQINFGTPPPSNTEDSRKQKKRRIIIDSDSDEDIN